MSLYTLEAWICAGLVPDLTLLLDLSSAQGRARATGRSRSDRIEAEDEDDAFFDRVRVGYLDRARAEPHRVHILDASRPPDEVLRDAWTALQTALFRRPLC